MELIPHSDGTWSMERVTELEHLMLARLPEAADPTGCVGAEHRLYPSPVAPTAELPPREEDAIERDWREFIEPDLRVAFAAAVETVVADVGAAHGSKVGGAVYYQIDVPAEHADAWCSALNQARLVLHHRHRLPDEDGDMDSDLDAERWMAMLQSEIYSIIMEFLVRKVLGP